MLKKLSPMKPKLSRILFVGLLANAVITPAVYAASNETISRSTAYAIGSLIVIAFGLALYLVFAIIYPEKF